MVKAIFISFFVFILTACNESQTSETVTSISSSACSKNLNDGSIVDCEPRIDSDSDLEYIHEQYKLINSETPGPIRIDHLKIDEKNLFKVKNINSDSSLTLESGRKIVLAGVECDKKVISI